ncbi:hypothetical protein FGB62_235g014 [Gracilaria domingensis]|nr:hypothetical protein FGB62_235g014 [Gracilaria domingensis]
MFSLHGTHWGVRRNRWLLLLIGIPVLAAELLFEFSFSVTSIDVADERNVWLPPSHERYYATLEDDSRSRPTSFPLQATESCVTGPIEMARSGSSTDTSEALISGYEYRMNGTYVVRKPYLGLDNTSVLCSTSKTTGRVSFVVPHVLVDANSQWIEGVYAAVNSSISGTIRDAFTNGSPFKFISISMRANDRVVCIRPRDFGYHCALYEEDSFILANTTIFWEERPFDNLTISVLLRARGSGVEGLKSQERRVRLIEAVERIGFLKARLSGRSTLQRLIDKDKVERIALMTLIAANEEGVGGVRQEVGTRPILSGSKQSATMKRMALIPIVLLAALTVATDGALRFLIARRVRGKGWQREGRGTRPWRVDTSIQWIADRIYDDLRANGANAATLRRDVSAKMLLARFGILPRTSTC